MNVQSASALLTLMTILALAGVFLNVRRYAREPLDYAPVQGKAYRIRGIGFWLLVLVGLPISVWLLRENPYMTSAAAPQIVNATGAQWYWDLDRDEVAAREPVEFRVTSTDVNHGFGLYDEGGTLVAQVQAMPGYINRLTHTFDKPGIYRVLCLEYCGLVHHEMVAELTVSAGKGEQQ